jgi:uncharacterized protein (TIGR03067 family)
VDQLRALEGTWNFERLELNGTVVPAGALAASRILIDGDRFRTESPEATYEGIFNINVEVEPHEIDIEFVAGPEAGNWNYGIFRLDGDQLDICLDINGKPRPEKFESSNGSGHAFEVLKRVAHARPSNVTGGTPSPAQKKETPTEDGTGFEFVESATLNRLQGKWAAAKINRDGQDLPGMMLRMASRVAKNNEVKITVAGQLIVHALVRIDENTSPMHVDYWNVGGACKGTVQYGLMKWVGEEACFCMSAPGQPRPQDFDSPAGSGRTVSQWKRTA